MTGPEAKRLDMIQEAVVAMGAILGKINEQLRPFGWTAGYEQDLREMEAALAELRRAG